MSGLLAGIAGDLAGGLLGGIFGNSKEKKRQAFEAQRIQMLVKDANKAGIHPLAALGSVQHQNPIDTAPSPIAEGIARAGGRLAAQRQEKRADQVAQSEVRRNEAEAMLLEAQSRSIAAGALAATRGGAAPTNSDPDSIEDRPGLLRTTGPNGETVLTPIGPDFSEVITGAINQMRTKAKAIGKREAAPQSGKYRRRPGFNERTKNQSSRPPSRKGNRRKN